MTTLINGNHITDELFSTPCKDFNPSHVNIKKLYNWFLIRESLLFINSSGLYDIRKIKEACLAQNINYNTIRSQLSFFVSAGLLVRNKGKQCVKIVELTGLIEKLYKLFKAHRIAIQESNNPKVYFADLWKARLIKCNVVAQAYKEVEKCKDKGNGKRLLKIVKGGRTPVGARQGINLSLNTIGNIMGRSKTTAHRATGRMDKTGIIKVQKWSLFVCDISELTHFRRAANFYGRLFVKERKVFERLQNSYILSP